MTFFSLDDVTFRANDRPVLAHTSWVVAHGERWAVLGPNGSGKSLLMRGVAGGLVVAAGRLRHQFLEDDPCCRDSIFGRLPRGSIELVAPAAERREKGGRGLFHQVRWHSSESHGTRVGDLLRYAAVEGLNPFRVDVDHDDRAAFDAARDAAVARLGLAGLLERGAWELSSGEGRKLQLARALCRAPRLLLVDDPFTGLDAESRVHIRSVFEGLVAEGMMVLCTTRSEDEIPGWVTHVLRLDGLRVVDAGPRAEVLARSRACLRLPAAPQARAEGSQAPPRGEALVEMHAVRVQYGAKIILEDVDWTVSRGEHWAIVGANGAGKSTLISLILGDNPQAYANDVRVFGRRRGSGETIWELRRRIGWSGPELDTYFPLTISCRDAVCSGWTGTFGLTAAPSRAERQRASELLDQLELSPRADEALAGVSAAERRLVFIARALVAHPALLLLDEPCQGLDGRHVTLVREAVDAAVRRGVGSVLYVTHVAAELPGCINRTLVLAAGRVVSRLSAAR